MSKKQTQTENLAPVEEHEVEYFFTNICRCDLPSPHPEVVPFTTEKNRYTRCWYCGKLFRTPLRVQFSNYTSELHLYTPESHWSPDWHHGSKHQEFVPDPEADVENIDEPSTSSWNRRTRKRVDRYEKGQPDIVFVQPKKEPEEDLEVSDEFIYEFDRDLNLFRTAIEPVYHETPKQDHLNTQVVRVSKPHEKAPSHQPGPPHTPAQPKGS